MSQPDSQHLRRDDVRSAFKLSDSQVAANNEKTIKFETPRKSARQPMPNDDFDNDKTISFCQQSLQANKQQQIIDVSQKTIKKLGFNRQQQSHEHDTINVLRPQHLHLIQLFTKIDTCVLFVMNFRQQKSVTFKDLRRNILENHRMDLDLVKLRKILYIFPKAYAVKEKKTEHIADADYILIPPAGKMNTDARTEQLKELMTKYLMQRLSEGDHTGDIPMANIENLNLEASRRLAMPVIGNAPKADFGRTEAIKMIVEKSTSKEVKDSKSIQKIQNKTLQTKQMVVETPKKQKHEPKPEKMPQPKPQLKQNLKQTNDKTKKPTKQSVKNEKMASNSRNHLVVSNSNHKFVQSSQPSSSSTCSTQPPIYERLNPTDLFHRHTKTKFTQKMYQIVSNKEKDIKRREEQEKLLGKKHSKLSPVDYRHFVDNLNMFYVQQQATNMFKVSVINDMVKRLNYTIEDIKIMMNNVEERGQGYIKTIHLSKGELLQLDISKGSHMSRTVETIDW